MNRFSCFHSDRIYLNLSVVATGLSESFLLCSCQGAMLAIPENDIVKIVRLHDGYHSVFGSSSQVPLPVSVPLLFRFMTHWLRGSSPLYLSASASARSRSLPQTRLDLGLRSTVSCFASLPRKEVIQPHLPIRLPCYDFTPVISLTFGSWPRFRLPH